VVVVVEQGALRSRPEGAVVFHPFADEVSGVSAGVFRETESIEFGTGGPQEAIPLYRKIMQATTKPLQAGALMRLGRCLRKVGRPDEALHIYEQLQAFGNMAVEGQPAELVALEARCTTLEEMGRQESLAQGAQEIYSGMVNGRWPLSRLRWEFCLQEVKAWAGPVLPPAPFLETKMACSAAVVSLWQRRETLSPQGQQVSLFDKSPVLMSWRSTAEQLMAVLGGREYLETLSRQVAGETKVLLNMKDREGHLITGQELEPQVTRTAAATRLPWDFSVSDAEPATAIHEAAARHRLLLAGMAIIGALILGSGYFTLRGIQRELAAGRLQSEFVSAVSHEFRTPLTSMRQLSDMLVKGRVPSEERRQQYYTVLARESLRLHRLVEKLLSFGRAEAGAGDYSLAPVELGELIRSVVTDFEHQADDFSVELALPAETCRVNADREMMSLALWNLLDNAAKYSAECRTAWVELSCNGRCASIAVRDRGVGIPRAEQRRIFGKFVRGAHGTASGAKGTGIGLALVEHVLRAHRGQVLVESEVGQGSTFTMVLPLSPHCN
jgi:signal transduction histidine kinase